MISPLTRVRIEGLRSALSDIEDRCQNLRKGAQMQLEGEGDPDTRERLHELQAYCEVLFNMARLYKTEFLYWLVIP